MDNIFNIPFINKCEKRFDEDSDGNRVFQTEKEKKEFDQDEILNNAELFNKYKNLSHDKHFYLLERGLMEITSYNRDGYPRIEWKNISQIDFLKKHIPRKSIIKTFKEAFGELVFLLPPRFEKKI